MKRLLLPLLALILSINLGLCAEAEKLDKVIAFVNDDVVTQSELDKHISMLRYQLQASKQQLPSEKSLKSHALQQLIDVDLQMQAAERYQIKISDAEIDSSIATIAKRNNFTVAELKQKLAEQNTKFSEYRNQIRKEMTISKLQREMVMRRIVITEHQLDDFIKTQYKPNEQAAAEYKLQHILVSLNDEPTPSDIQQAQKKADTIYHSIKSGKNFQKIASSSSDAEDALKGGEMGWHKLAELPQVFSKTIQHLKKGDISPPIKTNNGFHILRLQDVRNANADHTSVKTHVRHIMMKQDDLTSNQVVKRKLEKVRDHLQRGEDFAQYAELVSQDQRSASKGGDMGWVFNDELPTNFASTMNRLQLKEISKPIRTQSGWHIMQVLGRKTVNDTKRLQRQQARQMLFGQRMQIATQNWLKGLRGQAYIKIVNNG